MAYIGDKSTFRICRNVGELKKAIENLDDDITFDCECENEIKIQVFTNENDCLDKQLDISGNWD